MKTYQTISMLSLCLLVFSLNAQKWTNQNTTQNNKNEIAKIIEQEHRWNDFEAVNFLTLDQDRTSDNYDSHVSNASFYNLDKESVQSLYYEKAINIEVTLPRNNAQNWNFELTQVTVTTPDFVLTTSDGQQLSAGENNGLFYRGIIKGNPNSIVALSIYKNKVRAMIADETRNHVLAALKDNPNRYILYNDKNLQVQNPFQCEASDFDLEIADATSTSTHSQRSSNNCVGVYIECDFATYQSHNSDITEVQNYVSSLMNEVGALYQNENITIQLSQIHVWTSTDPYATLNSTLAVLDKFGEETQNNYNGRLAHLISTRSLGGGIAWVGVLCFDYSPFDADWDGDGVPETHHAGPYAFSANMNTTITPIPTYSWDVEVFAHEMGHNFGSPHTQNCSWGPNNDAALDDCYPTEGGCPSGPTPTDGGTIMSYCHLTSTGINFNNGFGQEPGDLLRDRYNNASCSLVCDDNSLSCQNSDRSALIALYNATDGANWTISWDLNQPMENWHGVTLNEQGCVTRLELGGELSCSGVETEGNNLVGTLPPELGDLSELTWLCMEFNSLTGPIPKELANLQNLRFLSLWGNQLSGEIPNELGSLSNLEILFLGRNQLTGSIPSELGNLSELFGLAIDNNQLTGSIPETLTNLDNLAFLNIPFNQLSGEIPVGFASMPNLSLLYLNDNQLSNAK